MVTPEEILEYMKYVAAFSLEKGVDAGAISEHFGIWRNEAVSTLGAMVLCGSIVKGGNKPILYFIPEKPVCSPEAPSSEDPPFSNIIGHNGSLAFQTQMAQAASAYPPHGIHTLILGETGVGKSLLASEMARNLRIVRKGDAKTVPFITFNCAEYAENPQLLLSHLFGHVRGAFTGAERNKEGLLEAAHGGILFLDEIHRLPSTGQEMLFTVIDKGLFRRLGDTTDREVQFMLVAATTSDPSAVLLDTFKRRMPLVIKIPTLAERPINERVDIIRFFFFAEAQKLNLSIRISPLVLKIMASFRGENNIGDLKNEIQLACARAFQKYAQHTSHNQQTRGLDIDIYYISRNLSLNYISDERVDSYFSALGLEEPLLISPSQDIKLSSNLSATTPSQFTDFFDSQLNVLRKKEHSPQEAVQLIASTFEQRSNDASSFAKNNPSALYGSISPTVWNATNDLIYHASQVFKHVYSQDTINSVAYFLQQLKAYANAERIVFNPSKFSDFKSFSEDTTFVRKMAPFLRSTLNIELMNGEIILLSTLLAQPRLKHMEPRANVALVGYGKVASSVASVVNQFLNIPFIKAFDFTDELSSDMLTYNLSAFLEENKQEAIIFTSLGLTPIVTQALKDFSKCRYCIFTLLDPMLVLECERSILMTETPLDDIVTSLFSDCKEYYGISFGHEICGNSFVPPVSSLETESSADMRDVIITYCITGTGSARIARELLLKNLTISASADVLPLGIMDDIYSIARKLGKRLKLIIGIMNPNILGISFVNIDQIFLYKDLDSLLRSKGLFLPSAQDLEVDEISNMSIEMRLKHCKEHLDYFAPSLDSNEVDEAVHLIIHEISNLYEGPLSLDLVVRIYVHCATMLERVASADPVPMPLDAYATIEQEAEQFHTLRKILNESCSTFALKIADAEVYYFMMTLPTDQQDTHDHPIDLGAI